MAGAERKIFREERQQFVESIRNSLSDSSYDNFYVVWLTLKPDNYSRTSCQVDFVFFAFTRRAEFFCNEQAHAFHLNGYVQPNLPLKNVYSLQWEIGVVNLEYLHLISNVTKILEDPGKSLDATFTKSCKSHVNKFKQVQKSFGKVSFSCAPVSVEILFQGFNVIFTRNLG